METPEYQRKWEEINRVQQRLKSIYSRFEGDISDDMQGPKDFFRNFFDLHYALKEALKNSKYSPQNFKGRTGEVETYINKCKWLPIGLDIANKEKHSDLTGPRTKEKIGNITSHITFSPGKAQEKSIEMRIEINKKQVDCICITDKIIKEWEFFLKQNNLI